MTSEKFFSVLIFADEPQVPYVLLAMGLHTVTFNALNTPTFTCIFYVLPVPLGALRINDAIPIIHVILKNTCISTTVEYVNQIVTTYYVY